MRVRNVRDPIADRLARGLLQRAGAVLDRTHLGAEQRHPLEVRPLAAHVLRAHVDDALEAEARAHRRRRDPVLAGAGLGHHPSFAEPEREQCLSERVVELVRPGVEEVFTLEVEPLSRREALGGRERRRPAGVVAAEFVQLCLEGRVGPGFSPAGFELVQSRDQRLRDEPAAVLAVGQLHRAAST